jgi:hypothetical protein
MKNIKNMIWPIALLIATSTAGFAQNRNNYQGQTQQHDGSYYKNGCGRDGHGGHDGYGHDGHDCHGHDGYGHDGYGHDGYGHDGYGKDGHDGYGYKDQGSQPDNNGQSGNQTGQN